MELPPQQLIDLAVRLAAYQGIVAARSANEADRGAGLPDGFRMVEPTQVGIAADPILSNIIDFN